MRSQHRWSELAVRFTQMLWRCPCQYANVATSRCHGCGSRPRRDLRAAVASTLADDQRAVAVPGAW